jgi:hypothetical protein
MTVLDRVEEVRRDLAPVDVRTALLTVWAAPFYAAGWLARKALGLVGLAVAAARTGWAEASPRKGN